ncbi:MAG: hypothetical protein ABI855_02075 [Bacteroidota bacterium]
MPKKIIVKVTWSPRKPLSMASFAGETVTDMTGNALTPSPDVPLIDITTAANLVVSTYATRNNGDLAQTNYENAVKDLDAKLHKNADYVSNLAGGDAAKIESTGYLPTSDSRHAAVRPAAPSAPKLIALGGKRIKSMVEKVIGAEDYTHIFYTDPDASISVTETQILISSKTPVTLVTGGVNEEASGFTELTKVFVGVVAHNAAGYSNLSSIVAQGVL